MSAICKGLSVGIDLHSQVNITRVNGSAGNWVLEGEKGPKAGPFDWVVCTAPPSQSAALLDQHSPISDQARSVVMRPCFSLMIVPTDGYQFPADGIRCDHPVLGWLANNHSKPGRPPDSALLVQSSPSWAEAHLEDSLAAVGSNLKASVEEIFDLRLSDLRFECVHRWLFAAPAQTLNVAFLGDPNKHLAICGDWCLAGKMEGAFLSGTACSQMVLS
jgi:predicted NAD/FAD-dependent oxidoreductase